MATTPPPPGSTPPVNLKIPKGKIKKGKYTSGGEYIVESTNASYKGYYYLFNHAAYAGKDYDPNALKLIPVKDRNKLLDKSKTLAVFSLLTGITSQALQSNNIAILPNTDLLPNILDFDKPSPQPTNVTKYYFRNTTIKDIIIKETNEKSYKEIKSNPIYQTTSITFVPSPGYAKGIPQNIDQAEKELPGVKIFLGL